MKMNDEVLNVYYLPGVQLIEQRKTTERRLGVLFTRRVFRSFFRAQNFLAGPQLTERLILEVRNHYLAE